MLTENIEALTKTIIITPCVNFRSMLLSHKQNKEINVVNVKYDWVCVVGRMVGV